MSQKTTKLFGTDGIRGVAGEYPLDPPTVYRVGRAVARFLLSTGSLGAASKSEAPVVVGEDTRESSRWIGQMLAAGLASQGRRSVSAGVLPTPGVAYLARTRGFAAGVMISASHNPYGDNGIKVFSASGYKLPDQQEHAIEDEIFGMAKAEDAVPDSVAGFMNVDERLHEHYVEFLCSRLPAGVSFKGLRIVLDCANGAAFEVAPEVFRRLGAEVTALSTSPDGRNINEGCGSLHTGTLEKRVPAEGADLGVAFDGDADRALFVTRQGELVNGDAVLYLAARRLRELGRLHGNTVVGTIMSNLGLEAALGEEGLKLLRTAVGDKYVLEEMLRTGAPLGGEQSGHVIFSDDHTTGDGLLTALRVIETVAAAGRPIDELVAGLRVYPQVIRNVRVREKAPFENLPDVSAAIRSSQEHFGDAGRVIVRYSGTELLARVMIEARDEGEVNSHADTIADAIRRSIGEKK